MPSKAKSKSTSSKTNKNSTVKKTSASKAGKKKTKISTKKKKIIAPKIQKPKLKTESKPIKPVILETEYDQIKSEAACEIIVNEKSEKQDNLVREEVTPSPVSKFEENIGVNDKREYKKDENLTDAEIQLVCFKIGFEEFGVDIGNVKEINRSAQVTKIVDAPVYVKGVIDLRGSIIPVIDLRTRMEYQEQEDNKNTRVIVLDNDGSLAGIKVDAVTEVIRLKKSQVEKAPEKAKTKASQFLKGIFKKEDNLILIIDGQKLI